MLPPPHVGYNSYHIMFNNMISCLSDGMSQRIPNQCPMALIHTMTAQAGGNGSGMCLVIFQLSLREHSGQQMV